jgi:3-hydroxypropanoate dehydrogenase
MSALSTDALDQLFVHARTHNGFTSEPVPEATLRRLYDLMKWGPTSMNCQPARLVFVTTPEGKARLAPALSPGNLDKTLAAPATVIIATDSRFYEHLPTMFPAYDARPMFEANAELAASTAFRNGTLQGAYLIVAARALGLDCGPMSGFDAGKLNAAFFPDGRCQANFLCNLGIGNPCQSPSTGATVEFRGGLPDRLTDQGRLPQGVTKTFQRKASAPAGTGFFHAQKTVVVTEKQLVTNLGQRACGQFAKSGQAFRRRPTCCRKKTGRCRLMRFDSHSLLRIYCQQGRMTSAVDAGGRPSAQL